MKSSTREWASPSGAERRVPSWARAIVAGLSRDLPRVVTHDDIIARLEQVGSPRTAGETIRELRRLGWLVHLGIAGAWTFIPPGQDAVVDPYLDLRAWVSTADPGCFLAGANAAWFLGYLDREPDGKVQIWVPDGTRLPGGLRRSLSTISLRWPVDARPLLPPSPKLLLRRRLDLTRWSSELPAFGPEALVVQLASRPASFQPWDDLVAHLARLVEDCDDDRLVRLLVGMSAATWQRAAYIVHSGGSPSRGIDLIEKSGVASLPVTSFGADDGDEGTAIWGGDRALWVPRYSLVDRLIAPLQSLVGKA